MRGTRFALLAGLLASSSAWGQAAPPASDLKRCLDNLGGIAWRLPYTPRTSVQSCTSPAGSYKARANARPGARELYLASAFDGLGAREYDMSSDERQAALQSAMLAHFEALFRRHGYTRAGNNRYSRADGVSLLWQTMGDSAWLITVEGQ